MKRIYSKGFTLLELMVLVAMAGALMAIGIPSFKSMMVTNELATTTNDLVASLKLARSEAIGRGQDIIVCSTTDGQQCSGVTNTWRRGWLVYVDLNGNTQVDEAAGELLSVTQLKSTSQITITADAAFDTQVNYSYTGILANGLAGQFQICSGYATDGFPRRDVSISVSGDPQFRKSTTNDC